jgi:hypothetical protein
MGERKLKRRNSMKESDEERRREEKLRDKMKRSE